MGDVFIPKSSAAISSFTKELGNGLTVEKFMRAIENADLNDGESLKKAVGSCTEKCRGTTVVISAKLDIKDTGDCPDGEDNCGKVTSIDLSGVQFRL